MTMAASRDDEQYFLKLDYSIYYRQEHIRFKESNFFVHLQLDVFILTILS